MLMLKYQCILKSWASKGYLVYAFSGFLGVVGVQIVGVVILPYTLRRGRPVVVLAVGTHTKGFLLRYMEILMAEVSFISPRSHVKVTASLTF